MSAQPAAAPNGDTDAIRLALRILDGALLGVPPDSVAEVASELRRFRHLPEVARALHILEQFPSQ